MVRKIIPYLLCIGCAYITYQRDKGHKTPMLAQGVADTLLETASPESQHMNPKAFKEFTTLIKKSSTTYALLILRKNKIIHEQYGNGASVNTLLPLHSTTKIVTTALIGKAIQDACIEDPNSYVLSYFPEISIPNMDPKWKSVQLAHILDMHSGMEYSESVSFYDFIIAGRKGDGQDLEHLFSSKMIHPPGAHFKFNSAATQLLSHILYRSYNQDIATVAKEQLFTPLGIQDYQWMSFGHRLPQGGMGLYLTARDFAKIGVVYLNDGQWQGQQLVPKEWINQCFDNPIPVEDLPEMRFREDARNSTAHIKNHWFTKRIENDLTVHFHYGHGGQMLMLIPQYDIVIVMHHKDHTTRQRNNEAFDRFYEKILPQLIESVSD